MVAFCHPLFFHLSSLTLLWLLAIMHNHVYILEKDQSPGSNLHLSFAFKGEKRGEEEVKNLDREPKASHNNCFLPSPSGQSSGQAFTFKLQKCWN